VFIGRGVRRDDSREVGAQRFLRSLTTMSTRAIS
jgi:hypothetical protein